jgi:8-oxo-dGTP pyrophosphatase MutT (NUDIX family)
MHSGAMRDDDSREARLTVVQSPARTYRLPANFVRLSTLRRLRECEQVAAVCYRVRDAGIEFLLVRTRGSGRWTFPKGSAEPGLSHAQAAALEAFEEAGVHGRIEEASFARYVRRRRGEGRKVASGSGERGIAVTAHLCEVLRLSPPKESNRDRTWFSVEDAKRCLREGRSKYDGSAFARVVDRAIARIMQVQRETGIVDWPLEVRPQEVRPQPYALQDDALQKVQFEAGETRHREASFTPHARRQFGDKRQSAVHTIVAQRREVSECEVLEFGPPRERNSKALGTGAKNG